LPSVPERRGRPVAPPSPNDAVSGIRISIYEPGSGPDYGIGVNASELWFGVALPTQHFSFYGGTTINARIPPNGSPPTLSYDLITLGWFQQNARTALTGPKTYHIAPPPTGSDTTGDGSAATPWATPQYAIDQIQATIDFGGQTVTVSMANGTYTGGLSIGGVPMGAIAAGESSSAAMRTRLRSRSTPPEPSASMRRPGPRSSP
jgi:hypothetical protein